MIRYWRVIRHSMTFNHPDPLR